MSTFAQIESLAAIAPQYRALRAQQPGEPATKILEYIRHAEYENYEQFHCRHSWNTPEEWEASYCLNCGLSGDV
jgi:hypothetical protein